MESELQIQPDISNSVTVVHDDDVTVVHEEIPHQVLSESILRSTLFQLNAQNESAITFPMLSSMQGEPFKGFHADKSVSYDDLLNRENLNLHELRLRGTSLASGSLGTLASRNGLNDDVNNLVVPMQQEIPMREMYSSGCAYVSSSSVPNTINCDYEALGGDANGKWYENRFLRQAELCWRTSASGLAPLQFPENHTADQWMLPNSTNVCSDHPYGMPISQNELSLSLTTCRPSLPCSASIQDCCSNMSSSSVIYNSQSQRRIGSECSSQGNKELSLGFASTSRSPQFSPIISGSRYLSALQQILSELSNYSLLGIDQSSFSTGLGSSSSSHLFTSNHFIDQSVSFKPFNEIGNDDGSLYPMENSYRRREIESKRSQLLALLQVVDDCYNQCLDEIHTVISAFHAATELDPQLHTCFALRTVSFFYKNLREKISNHILAMGVDSGSTRDNVRSFEKSFIQKQWALQQLKRKDQQLWRPQRGLPERSVSVLRAWMFENFLHPYPKDSEKHLLAIKSGLTRSQVSNWFINARVRLWKPLVEEMCIELNRKKGPRQNEEPTNTTHRSQLCIYDCNQRFDS